MKLTKYLVAGAILTVSGAAFAAPSNDNRPFLITDPDGCCSEQTLQSILDDTVGAGTLHAENDQQTAALWSDNDSASRTFAIDTITANNVNLGIYARGGLGDASKMYDFTLGDGGSPFQTFSILGGDLYVNANKVKDDFGSEFGFYLAVGSTKYATEDDQNGSGAGPDSNIRALTYLIPANTDVFLDDFGPGKAFTTGPGDADDWIIAFEDGGDNDFQDGVFIVQDITAIPVPATLALFGLGLLGLRIVSRRKA